MVIICNNSRFLQAIPVKNMTAENVANKLLESFANFSVPRIIRLDTGFRSALLTMLREKLGIATSFSAPYHSDGKGGVERANQTVLQTLKKFIHKYGSRWDWILLFWCQQFEMYLARQREYLWTSFKKTTDIARDVWTNGDKTAKQLKMPTIKYLENYSQI